MPHSSGGGSHSGGSHSGSGFSSSSSSSGGSSAKHIKHTSFPGARRYVYYENYRPVYVYADYDIRKGTASGKFFSILGSAVSLLFGIMLLAMCYDKPQKMDTSPSYSCEIVDCAGVIDDADMVQSAIDDFYDETGIPVEVMTVNNEDWQGSYSKLEDFAYDMYVTEFDDEEHWLVVYSEPTSPDPDFNDWYWEGMRSAYPTGGSAWGTIYLIKKHRLRSYFSQAVLFVIFSRTSLSAQRSCRLSRSQGQWQLPLRGKALLW